MKTFYLILFTSLAFCVQAQVNIEGVVETKTGIPVAGANIFIQGSYDGCTTDGKVCFHHQHVRHTDTDNQLYWL